MKLLTKRELQVMTAIWHSTSTMSANDIQSALSDISINTILSVLRKLMKEGLIQADSVEMSHSTLMRRYKAVLQESEYLTHSASDKALKQIVASFIDDASSDQQLDELQSLINKRRKSFKKQRDR